MASCRNPTLNGTTSGHDRIWLTTQPDLSLTKREAQWLAEHGGMLNMIPVFENGRLRFARPQAWISTDRWVGGGLLGRPMKFVRGEPQMRLTVRIRKNDLTSASLRQLAHPTTRQGLRS